MSTEQEILDQQQIIAATVRMAVLADRREWDMLVEEVFTDEVMADYTALMGGEPFKGKAVDLVAGWKKGLTTFTATQHLVTNHEVSITGNRAEVRAYFQATHCKPDNTLWVLGGRYHYRVEKLADRWRISAITLTPIWARDERNTSLELHLGQESIGE